jgi:cell division cycle 2-like protein
MAVKRVAAAACAVDSFADLQSSSSPAPRSCKRSRICCSDEYEETGVLGEGGFGLVVMARHRATGEIFAVKALHPASTKKPAADVGDMMREVAFLAACRGHRSLVNLRELSCDPATNELSLVMEYVGPSPFPEAEVRCVMRELLHGAEHMHSRRIVHRDIKRRNIVIGEAGVKICDLGLAMSTSETPPYGRCGTLRYMAPEVILGKPDYDTKVDMWSLGCVMAELLRGEPILGSVADDAEQPLRIFEMLGVSDQWSWPAYDSMPLAGEGRCCGCPGICELLCFC